MHTGKPLSVQQGGEGPGLKRPGKTIVRQQPSHYEAWKF